MTLAAAAATVSTGTERSGATPGTTPSMIVRPASTHSPMPSRSAAVSLVTSTEMALKAVRARVFHGTSVAQT
ncbi:Uncharacterised protein [Mycobacteroides abscessus subsp. abscessus]|nr:Uncharacterised protein [Mycobacteroides abscessus subsp. abscessus]